MLVVSWNTQWPRVSNKVQWIRLKTQCYSNVIRQKDNTRLCIRCSRLHRFGCLHIRSDSQTEQRQMGAGPGVTLLLLTGISEETDSQANILNTRPAPPHQKKTNKQVKSRKLHPLTFRFHLASHTTLWSNHGWLSDVELFLVLFMISCPLAAPILTQILPQFTERRRKKMKDKSWCTCPNEQLEKHREFKRAASDGAGRVLAVEIG